MHPYVISCGSTTDLPRNYYERREVALLHYHYTIEDKTYVDDLGQTLPATAFYKLIEGGAMPTTSQVNALEYIDFFEPFLKQGQDVLHIAFSSGLSGSYQSAMLAREDLTRRYPKRQVLIVDSLAASAGYGLLLDAACDLRDRGSSIKDVYDWLSDNRRSVHHWFFSTDLTHFKRGGRVSASAAMIGSLLNICPIMHVDPLGKLVPVSKVRGRRNALRIMLETMEQHASDKRRYSGKCFISHASAPQDAATLAQMITDHFPMLDGQVTISDIGAVIGAHTGPGTVALFYFGDPRE